MNVTKTGTIAAASQYGVTTGRSASYGGPPGAPGTVKYQNRAPNPVGTPLPGNPYGGPGGVDVGSGMTLSKAASANPGS